MLIPSDLEPSVREVFNTFISFWLRLLIILKASFSAILLISFLLPQQLGADLPHFSSTPFSWGISNSTKGLDKSKEQNVLQA
jgi:hypothetical protein